MILSWKRACKNDGSGTEPNSRTLVKVQLALVAKFVDEVGAEWPISVDDLFAVDKQGSSGSDDGKQA